MAVERNWEDHHAPRPETINKIFDDKQESIQQDEKSPRIDPDFKNFKVTIQTETSAKEIRMVGKESRKRPYVIDSPEDSINDSINDWDHNPTCLIFDEGAMDETLDEFISTWDLPLTPPNEEEQEKTKTKVIKIEQETQMGMAIQSFEDIVNGFTPRIHSNNSVKR